jgi:hypothetical protein
MVAVSAVTASEYAHQLDGSPSLGLIVAQSDRVLGASRPVRPNTPLPRRGTVTLGHDPYRAVTVGLSGFGPAPVDITVSPTRQPWRRRSAQVR